MLGQETDSVCQEWKQSLKSYPPLLTPRQVQEASLGILRANDIYRRNHRDGKHLELDCRTIGGKVFVTRDSLVTVLVGKPDLPL